MRDRLPPTRHSIDHAVRIAGRAMTITAGHDAMHRILEFFIRAEKPGHVLRVLLDVVAAMASIALQYGAPLEVITNKLRWQRFGPAGRTDNASIPTCTSPLDYVAQWLPDLQGRLYAEIAAKQKAA